MTANFFQNLTLISLAFQVFAFARKSPDPSSPGSLLARLFKGDGQTRRQNQESSTTPQKSSFCQRGLNSALFLYTVLVVSLSALSSVMCGFRRRLKNTRQVPAPRAFVSDQTGLVEERRDARDLFASRTQQGSCGALTRHRLLHVGAPFRFVCTPSTFQRSYSALVASACASGHARDARDGRVMARIYAALGGARCYEHRRV